MKNTGQRIAVLGVVIATAFHPAQPLMDATRNFWLFEASISDLLGCAAVLAVFTGLLYGWRLMEPWEDSNGRLVNLAKLDPWIEYSYRVAIFVFPVSIVVLWACGKILLFIVNEIHAMPLVQQTSYYHLVSFMFTFLIAAVTLIEIKSMLRLVTRHIFKQ